MTSLHFDVRGTPAPQGSKRHVGRGIMVESSANVKPWREAVKYAAMDAMRAVEGFATLDEPIALTLVFRLARPTSAPKRVIWPAKKPDWDKISRAVADSLTDAGVYVDDARVVEAHVYKRFATATEPPGVEIVVCPVFNENGGAA